MSVQEMDAIKNTLCESDTLLKYNGSKPTKFINDSHAVKLIEVLQSLRKYFILCDIKLETDDGTIVVAHKNVLISASPYFHAMFISFDESNKDVVNIRDLDSAVLKLLVDYIYTGEILVTNENVQDLLPASNLLQLEYVSKVCEDFMKKQLGASNCLGIKAFAYLHDCSELYSSSEAYIKKHFVQVSECEEFLSLSFEEVIKLISCDDLSAPAEEKVFECVINWVKHELDSRKEILPKLLEHIRLPLVSTQYIINKISKEPLLINSLKCKNYIIEALHFHLLNKEQSITIPQTIRTKPRQFDGLQKVILMFNKSNTMPECYTEWYDPTTKLRKKAPEMNDCRMTAGLGVIRDTFIFAVGGVNCSSSQSVHMLDLSSQSPCWIPVTDMLISRKYLGVGVLGDCIYAIGGTGGISSLDSVEVFDFNEWKMLSSMSTRRQSVGVGVLNNYLYAIGGSDETETDSSVSMESMPDSTLKSVERYDPILNTWTPIVEMSICRSGPGVGVIGDVIYAIGGEDDDTNLKSAEAFRPSDGFWYDIADMHLPRVNPGVVAFNGLLYVMGGYDGDIYLDSIEIYNPNTNTWSMESLSRNDIYYIYGGVVVDRPPHFITN